MLKKIITLTSVSLLVGCVGIAGMAGSIVKAYDGPKRPQPELALLIGSEKEGYGHALLASVDGIAYGDDFLRGWPTKVNVLPGIHEIKIKCFVGNKYAFPTAKFKFEAGKKYSLLCEDVGNNMAQTVILETNN